MKSVIYIPTHILEILTQEELQRLVDNLFAKGGEQTMKAKSKGLTKNQKLKKLKTSKAKKLVKSTKK